jgi:hypothetical protein
VVRCFAIATDPSIDTPKDDGESVVIGPGAGVHSGVGADDDFDESLPPNRKSMEPDMYCPVCGIDAQEVTTTIDGMSIACTTCGEYEISNVVLATEEWQRLAPDERTDLLNEAKRSTRPGTRPMIASYSLA